MFKNEFSICLLTCNYQFIFLKQWPHETWWHHGNTTWHILSIFPLILIFWHTTNILKNDIMFLESLKLRISEVLALQKGLSNEIFGNIFYLLLIRNNSALISQKYIWKYSLTSKVNQIWNFIIFSKIFTETYVVIKMLRELAHHF